MEDCVDLVLVEGALDQSVVGDIPPDDRESLPIAGPSQFRKGDLVRNPAQPVTKTGRSSQKLLDIREPSDLFYHTFHGALCRQALSSSSASLNVFIDRQ
jgi:hypothetical protein